MQPPRWRYWALNVSLVGLCLVVFAALSKGFAVLGWMLPCALAVLALQEPLLRRHRRWWAWLLVFLLGMWTFLFLFGAVYGGELETGGRPSGDLVGRLDAGVRFVLFGTLFGGWLLPAVVVPNFLLARWMFGPKASSR